MGEESHRKIGTVYEQKACAWLKQAGYQILETNFTSRSGEIDIIAKDGPYFVFVEVKYRKHAYAGAALEAVDGKKQEKIKKTAQYFLYKKMHADLTALCRFDVIAYEGDRAVHIKNAF